MLIAGGGSPLGFGTDLGGSSRIPASFCGVASIKPTCRRVSIYGVFARYKRCVLAIDTAITPMARKVDSLVDGLRCLCQPMQNELDPYTIPLPFNEAAFAEKKRLVIGYYTDFATKGLPTTVPSVQRAVLEAKAILEKAGHTLVPFIPPDPARATQLFASCIYADGGW